MPPTAPIAADSWVGELYEDGAGTRDHEYGRDGARELARNEPGRAQSNADNYEYYAETSPRL